MEEGSGGSAPCQRYFNLLYKFGIFLQFFVESQNIQGFSHSLSRTRKKFQGNFQKKISSFFIITADLRKHEP